MTSVGKTGLSAHPDPLMWGCPVTQMSAQLGLNNTGLVFEITPKISYEDKSILYGIRNQITYKVVIEIRN